jgi:D-arabinose 1-dehydrogenase-like Zn-dependent alcohol dehydrogenase
MGGRQEALEVMELIKSNRVEPLLTEISLSDVPEYMDRLQHGTVVGKIVVRISG